MANIFQKMFLSKGKIADINQKNDMLQLIRSNPIAHHSYMTQNGYIVRRFSIKTPDYTIYAERECDTSRSEDKQVSFSFRFGTQKKVTFATNSAVDMFAKKAYMKMYKIWEKNYQHAK